MKTKLILGLVALGVLISACSVEELQNDDFKLNKNKIEIEDFYSVSTDSTSTIKNDDDLDTGKEDPIKD